MEKMNQQNKAEKIQEQRNKVRLLPEFASYKQVLEATGWSDKTLRRYVVEGRLITRGKGNQKTIITNSLIAYLQDNKPSIRRTNKQIKKDSEVKPILSNDDRRFYDRMY